MSELLFLSKSFTGLSLVQEENMLSSLDFGFMHSNLHFLSSPFVASRGSLRKCLNFIVFGFVCASWWNPFFSLVAHTGDLIQ